MTNFNAQIETRLRADRIRFGLCLLITIVLGAVSFFMRDTAFDNFANHAGGFFYVLAWIFFILMLSLRLSSLKVCVLVFLGTCALEVLQLWHPPILEAIRSTLPGQVLIGTTFAWSDFPAYGVGAFIGWVVAKKITADENVSRDKPR